MERIPQLEERIASLEEHTVQLEWQRDQLAWQRDQLVAALVGALGQQGASAVYQKILELDTHYPPVEPYLVPDLTIGKDGF